MGKIKTIELSEGQRDELEKGYRHGKTHAVRERCQLILLKSEGRSSKQVAAIIKKDQNTVNTWVKRYHAVGIVGLSTKPGRGRKLLLDKEKDGDKVRVAIQAERQRISQAKVDLEEQLGKRFSEKTLKRFLKNLTALIKE